MIAIRPDFVNDLFKRNKIRNTKTKLNVEKGDTESNPPINDATPFPP